MVNHRVRDENGELLSSHNKDPPDSWYMKRLRKSFPQEDTTCYALGKCIRILVAEHVTTIKELNRIAPLLKKTGTFVAARESQYFSDIRKALTKHERSADFRELAKKLFIQTTERNN